MVGGEVNPEIRQSCSTWGPAGEQEKSLNTFTPTVQNSEATHSSWSWAAEEIGEWVDKEETQGIAPTFSGAVASTSRKRANAGSLPGEPVGKKGVCRKYLTLF